MSDTKLAALVLQLLDLQRQTVRAYGPHKAAVEQEIVERTAYIRKVCEAIIGKKEPGPGLFENPRPTAH